MAQKSAKETMVNLHRNMSNVHRLQQTRRSTLNRSHGYSILRIHEVSCFPLIGQTKEAGQVEDKLYYTRTWPITQVESNYRLPEGRGRLINFVVY